MTTLLKRMFMLLVILGGVGCTSKPIKQPNQVEVAENQLITLPQPNTYGTDLSLSQLITVDWSGGKQQLPVQLQLIENQLVLAGFASWGSRILSLDYDGMTLDTYVMVGLSDTLPAPEQVLFNMMITLWPAEAWQQPLRSIGWSLDEKGNQRRVINNAGDTVLSIDYQSITEKLSGNIVLSSPQLGYVITIKTFPPSQAIQKKKNG